jgi:hypothetical protein
MGMNQFLPLDDLREYARAEIERDVDETILREPDLQDRLMLMRNRARIVDKLLDLTIIANLQYQLKQRRRIQLVEPPE